MITGSVNAFLEAVVGLQIYDTQGRPQQFEVVIDTGFNGSLTLPLEVIQAFGLPYRRSARALLSDGSETVFDIYEATADWDGHTRRISVDAAETDSLLGMALLEGYELRIQTRPSGQVFITPLLLSQETE